MANKTPRLTTLFLLTLTLLSISQLALAAGTKVFFVGGYLASPAQMRCWEKGAYKNSPGDYEFEGIPYPQGYGSGYESAVAGASGQIARIVREINANPDKKYIIAGHSSGAAISNTIAARATSKGRNRDRVRQVILDGFISPRLPGTKCWASTGPGGAVSRNYSAMRQCGSNMRVYQDNHCDRRSQWCLHFTIVNKSVPALLREYWKSGYAGCDTNLDWLQGIE